MAMKLNLKYMLCISMAIHNRTFPHAKCFFLVWIPLNYLPILQNQSLNQIEMEIKFAYRFDVAGCADLFNETTKITKDVFYIGASCKELD